MAELTRPRTAQPIQGSPPPFADVPPTATPRTREPAEWERQPLQELGQILEQARLAAGLTLDDLGPVVGSRGSLARIERGAVRTRASRLRPWLAHLGVDPDPVIERFAAVLAPEHSDGHNSWRPVAPVERHEPRGVTPPPLEAYDQAALGAELWRMRAQAGLSRAQLAARLQVSRIKVWLVERGQRQPSPELLEAWLAEVARPWYRTLLALRFPGRIQAKPARRRWDGAPGSIQPRTNGRFARNAAQPTKTEQ
jgi:transcriptional regulator with XRE-family HTH domain